MKLRGTKHIPVLFLTVLALTLASCIEITQYVGMEKGKLVVDYRMTFQKALLAMAQSMGGEGDGVFTLTDESMEKLRSSFPDGMLLSAEKIDTELENGLAMRLRYSSNEAPDLGATEFPVFFPYRKGKSLVVDIADLDPSGASESNEMAAAILSGFKYRLIIERSALPNPRSAVLVSDTATMPAALIVYPEVAIVEVSMGLIMAAESKLKLVVE